MLVSSSFSLWGARRDLGIGRLPQKLEGCHKTAQSLRTTRLSHICQAFLIGFEFQKNIYLFFIEILVQVGASINIWQAFSIIFQYVEKNAFWFQSWSFNTSQAFSISFYSALTGKSLADLKVKRDGEFEFDWFPTQLASRRTKGLNFSRTRRTVSVQFSGDWSWLESSQLEMSRRMNTELMRRLWIKLNCWPETVSLQKK